jgi:hypothetical protein
MLVGLDVLLSTDTKLEAEAELVRHSWKSSKEAFFSVVDNTYQCRRLIYNL